MQSIWERLFRTSPPARPQPANDAGLEAVLADLRERVRLDAASGFYGWNELVANAVAYVQDEAPGIDLRPYAERSVAEALAALRAEEKAWPAKTDCDRLDAAFAALEAGGIVMRQNFTCCGTCGSAEIWDEMDAFEAAGGGPAYGYGFYHMQDTDLAVEGDGLYLNYGARDEGEESAIATGRAIVAELERHGLKTEWDGSWAKRIGVTLDWKRRQRA
jgi:hypothetical protein